MEGYKKGITKGDIAKHKRENFRIRTSDAKNAATKALEKKMHPQVRRIHEQSKEPKQSYSNTKNRNGGFQ